LVDNLVYVHFVQTALTDIRWPDESFDIVYCQSLLLKYRDPQRTLREMYRMLKPNGVLVYEQADLSTAGGEPSSTETICGVVETPGGRLYQMIRAAGFVAPTVNHNQAVAAQGEIKRGSDFSVADAGPANDGDFLAVVPRMLQMLARKPAIDPTQSDWESQVYRALAS
jgi:SAM-dependent methyltransferase